MKFGFKNPGPIYAFPLNDKKISKENDFLIKPNDVIFIPWHPNILEEMTHNYYHLVNITKKNRDRTLNNLKAEKSKLNSILFIVDRLAYLIRLHKKVMLLSLNLSEKEAQEWIIKFLYSDMAQPIIAILFFDSKTFKNLDLNIKFFARIILEYDSLSFWATYLVGNLELDRELRMGGIDVYHTKITNKINLDCSRNIGQLYRIIDQIKKQKNMDFYRKRI